MATENGTETTVGDWLVLVSENYSPIDFMLIGGHWDRFAWGALVTLELTALALILGGMLSIPLALARAYKHPIWNGPVWCYTYFSAVRRCWSRPT